MEIHEDISRRLLNPPPKGQVGGSNPLRDANKIKGLPKKPAANDNYRVHTGCKLKV